MSSMTLKYYHVSVSLKARLPNIAVNEDNKMIVQKKAKKAAKSDEESD